MIFCTNCGKQMPDGTVFCTNCGAHINRIQEAPAAAQRPNPAPQPAPAYAPVNNTQNVYRAPQPAAEPAKKTSGLAKASKGVGIAGFFIGGLAFAVLAIIMAVCSKEDTGGILSDDARVGKICGIVNIILRAISVLFLMIFYIGIVVALINGGSGVFGEIAEKIRDLFEEIF